MSKSKKSQNVIVQQDVQEVFKDTITYQDFLEISEVNEHDMYKVHNIVSRCYKDVMIFTEGGSLYYYDTSLRIWKPQQLALGEGTIISKRIQSDYDKLTQDEKDRCNEKRLGNKIVESSAMIKIRSSKYFDKTVVDSIKHGLFMSLIQFDSNNDEVHFENGYMNLKTLTFHQRKREQFISKVNPWSYTPDIITKESRDYIEDNFLKIYNNSKEVYDFNMLFNGYCITGEKNLNVMMIAYGKKAGNGKTTILEKMINVFPIYCIETNKKAIEENDKQHKYLIHMKGVRLMVIEEACSDKQASASIIKQLTGNKYTCEIMYGTSEVIENKAKIHITCNEMPRLKTDEGTERRIIVNSYDNKFITNDPNEIKKAQEAKKRGEILNYYMQDDHFATCEELPIYKNTIALILMEFANKYYKLYYKNKANFKLDMPKVINEKSSEIYGECDKVKKFIESNFDMTGDDRDTVGYVEMFNTYRKMTYDTHTQFSTLKNSICNIPGITYSINVERLIEGKRSRGGFKGLRFINTPYMFEETDNQVNDEKDKLIEKLRNDIRELKKQLEKQQTVVYNEREGTFDDDSCINKVVKIKKPSVKHFQKFVEQATKDNVEFKKRKQETDDAFNKLFADDEESDDEDDDRLLTLDFGL